MAIRISASQLVNTVTNSLGLLLSAVDVKVEMTIHDSEGSLLVTGYNRKFSDRLAFDVQLIDPQKSPVARVTLGDLDTVRRSNPVARKKVVEEAFLNGKLQTQLQIVSFAQVAKTPERPAAKTDEKAKSETPILQKSGLSGPTEAELIAAGLLRPSQTKRQPEGKAIEYVVDPKNVNPDIPLEDLIAAGLVKAPSPVKIYQEEMDYGDRLRANAAKNAALAMQRIIEDTKKETNKVIADIEARTQVKKIDSILDGKEEPVDEFGRPTQPAPKPFPKPQQTSSVPALRGVVGRRNPTKAF